MQSSAHAKIQKLAVAISGTALNHVVASGTGDGVVPAVNGAIEGTRTVILQENVTLLIREAD